MIEDNVEERVPKAIKNTQKVPPEHSWFLLWKDGMIIYGSKNAIEEVRRLIEFEERSIGRVEGG